MELLKLPGFPTRSSENLQMEPPQEVEREEEPRFTTGTMSRIWMKSPKWSRKIPRTLRLLGMLVEKGL